ncbi:hypothetical protein BGY98DRAFT_989624 [Russula aff. rugulosa BPL654]|nr:hypothetical protein BGY98DRAFT_989624 [Russula aff. rugulosa BPL654]
MACSCTLRSHGYFSNCIGQHRVNSHHFRSATVHCLCMPCCCCKRTRRSIAAQSSGSFLE